MHFVLGILTKYQDINEDRTSDRNQLMCKQWYEGTI